MPKIKELSNAQLQDYLEAYQAEADIFPSTAEYKEKIEYINQALKTRKLNGFDIKKPGFFSRLFKRNKGNK
jgi:hypothetical protein